MGCLKISYQSRITVIDEKQIFVDFGYEKNARTKNNCSNYYSGGMLMPNRHGGEYRFGYQGSEMDNEVKGKGNSHTTYFRQLDVRLNRWLSIDPKANQLPHQSPYCPMDNNPIKFNDPMGDKVENDIFKDSKSGEVTIIKTDDNFDRLFIDGVQKGGNLDKGSGFNNYPDAKVVDLGNEWNKEYVKIKDRIIALSAYRTFQDWVEEGETDNETNSIQIVYGIIDLGGNVDNFGFFQTFYSNWNPMDNAPPGQYLDGDENGMYPDSRYNSYFFEDRKLFDLSMYDAPKRIKEFEPSSGNMLWRGQTSLLYKTTSDDVIKIQTLDWGWKTVNSKVSVNHIKPRKNPTEYHLKNQPKQNIKYNISE